MIFTNVPGWLKPVHFCGGLAKRFFYLGSALSNLATTISAVSCHKRIILNLTSDTS